MKKTLKIIGISIVSILLLASLASCCLYGWIKTFAPQKSISVTIKGGTLEGVEDEDLQYIFNIRKFDDMFEIRLNSFMDETKAEVYGMGIQFFNPEFGVYSKFWKKTETGFRYHYVNEYFANSFYTYTTYAGNTHAEDIFNKEEPTVKDAVDEALRLYKNAYFTVTIGDNIYKFTFKDENVLYNSYASGIDRFSLYDHVNFMKVCADLYEKSSSFKESVGQPFLFNFEEYLNFARYDATTKTYSKVLDEKDKDYALVIKHMKSFFAVKVDYYKRPVKKASESLFDCVYGVHSYNVTDESISDDYFIGQNMINLDERDFEYRINDSGEYYLVLKDSVKEYYSQFSNLALNVDFNMTYLETVGVSDFIINEDELNLGELKLYRITKTTYDEAGKVLNSEVAYE